MNIHESLEKNLKQSETDIQILDLTGGLTSTGIFPNIEQRREICFFCLLCKVPNVPKT